MHWEIIWEIHWELFGNYLGTIWEFMGFRVVAQAAYCSRPRGVNPEDVFDIMAFPLSLPAASDTADAR